VCALSLDHITPKTLALYGLLTFASLRARLYSLTSAFRDLTDLLKNECFIYAKLSSFALGISTQSLAQPVNSVS
jgi:hypothetical protein